MELKVYGRHPRPINKVVAVIELKRTVQWTNIRDLEVFKASKNKSKRNVDLVFTTECPLRTALQKSLQAPHFYIEDESVRIEGLDEIPPSLPDISIAYKLHLECGRLADLSS